VLVVKGEAAGEGEDVVPCRGEPGASNSQQLGLADIDVALFFHGEAAPRDVGEGSGAALNDDRLQARVQVGVDDGLKGGLVGAENTLGGADGGLITAGELLDVLDRKAGAGAVRVEEFGEVADGRVGLGELFGLSLDRLRAVTLEGQKLLEGAR
jgi:hypothetical protein